MSTDPRSIREQILDNIATRFKNVVAGNTVTIPYSQTTVMFTQTWNTVLRHIPAQTDIKAGSCVAIITGKETTIREMGFDKKHLNVVIEFYDNVLEGDEVSTQQSRILLDLQSTLLADKTCGGLALDIVEVQNECSIEGPAQKVMAGMLEIQIQYRHRAGDPRLQR